MRGLTCCVARSTGEMVAVSDTDPLLACCSAAALSARSWPHKLRNDRGKRRGTGSGDDAGLDKLLMS